MASPNESISWHLYRVTEAVALTFFLKAKTPSLDVQKLVNIHENFPVLFKQWLNLNEADFNFFNRSFRKLT